MEPKQYCKSISDFDIIIVPAVSMTRTGDRLGYGMGYYDKFLANKTKTTIALAYSKSIAKNIPRDDLDVKIDIVITEDEIIHSEKS